ncbi:MAG TPA: LON peptidase substrate-binding domain-containing protein [Pirellulales bacterium]
MSGLPDDFVFRPDEFSGRARLFPLPNLVMFPHVLQPLHVFEPRYRELLADALEGDRMMAMAVLKPGWEADYEGRPAIHPVACLCRVVTHQALEDGRSNLLLVGLRRLGVVRELPPERPFREAEVLVLDDYYPAESGGSRPDLQRRLIDQFRHLMPNLQELHQQLDEVLANDVPLGMLTDILSFTLKFDQAAKEQLLRETNVDRRAQRLLEAMQAQGALDQTSARFPPDFSEN